MDLELVGRHALLFDDDAMAAFVNSPAALVDWNSLSIDRYDVRHLLSAPPPRPRRHRHSPSPNPDDSLESELDLERYLDLPSDELERENVAEKEVAAGVGFHAVPFSYGNPSESTERKDDDAESVFRPPFSLPERLLQNLPPTEKVHQIIARTAMFVSKHGGQSEIVLRVKQGDNPTFGFLMPDHVLHPYFRYLVDHQELLSSDIDSKSLEEDNRAEIGSSGIGGALSLLGSAYESGEEEECATGNNSSFAKNDYEESAKADNAAVSHGSVQNDSLVNVASKDEVVSKNPVLSSKEKAHLIKRNRSISTVKGGTTTGSHKEGDTLGLVSSTVNKLQASASRSLSKDQHFVLEPPSDMKRVVDKIVEFILRNGKEFEAVLVQQDTKHGRFPFLLPSNQYYPYYLKVLEKAQESRLAGKGIISEKQDSLGHGTDLKSGSSDSNARSLASDIPYDSDRKEKFKMVIGKSKKDGQDVPSKVTQPPVGVSVDAAAAAAILQAARKGIRNPNLDILSLTSMNGASQGRGSEDGELCSSFHSSRSRSSIQNLDQNGKVGISVPAAKAIAETAAIVAAGEADSSDASLTREQQLKAERLKRAKMFSAMIKSGAAPLKSEPLRGLSSEPPESGFSGSGAEVLNLAGREREGSTLPLDIDIADKIEKSEKKDSVDGHRERRSKRRYRSRSNKDGEEEEEEEEVEEDSDHKHSRKKRRSHRSSHHSRSKHKYSKRHSSSKDKDSRQQHKHYSASDDEQRHSREEHNQSSSTDDEQVVSRDRQNQDNSDDDERRRSRHGHKHNSFDVKHRQSRHRHKHDTSSDDDHKRPRRRYKHDVSSDDELRHSRWKHKHDGLDDEHQHYRHQQTHGSSSDDEHRHQIKSAKHRKISRLEREADLEEGEILAKSDQSKASEAGDGGSREPSVDPPKYLRAPSQPSEATGVSDDLRAKIRAMLKATF